MLRIVLAASVLSLTLSGTRAPAAEDFTGDYANLHVSATIADGWSRQAVLGSSPSNALLGAWGMQILGDEGSMQLRVLRGIRTIEEYLAMQSDSANTIDEGHTLSRVWSVFEGDYQHTQLFREQNANGRIVSYHLRVVRFERRGDRSAVMTMFVELTGNPGGHADYRNARRLRDAIRMVDSFWVEAR